MEFSKLLDQLEGHPAMKEFKLSGNFYLDNNCGAGWKSCLVQPDLKLRPCGMFPPEYSSNILKNKEFRKKMYLLSCPNNEVCDNCKYLYFCKGCIFRGWIKAQEIGLINCKWVMDFNVERLMNDLLKSH